MAAHVWNELFRVMDQLKKNKGRSRVAYEFEVVMRKERATSLSARVGKSGRAFHDARRIRGLM